VVTLEGRDEVAAAVGWRLFVREIRHVDKPWSDPEQPLIFAIGPLTGYFPLMSKTVCAFKSPYHDQYAESHGEAVQPFPCALPIMTRLCSPVKPRGFPLLLSAQGVSSERCSLHARARSSDHSKMLRRMFSGSVTAASSASGLRAKGARPWVHQCGHLPPFRRLGAGAVMGAKNLKGS